MQPEVCCASAPRSLQSPGHFLYEMAPRGPGSKGAQRGARSKGTPPVRSKVQDWETSQYRYATKRLLRGKAYWVAQAPKRQQKLFHSQVLAAKWLAEKLHTTTNALQKGRRLHTLQGVQARLALATSVYGQGSELPGDAEYLKKHSASQIFAEEPDMEILDIQAKYGPFRDELAKCFKRHGPIAQVLRFKVQGCTPL